MGMGMGDKRTGAYRDVLRGMGGNMFGVGRRAAYLQRDLYEGSRELLHEDDGPQRRVDEGFEMALSDACSSSPSH